MLFDDVTVAPTTDESKPVEATPAEEVAPTPAPEESAAKEGADQA
ncbi:MAG: hypothetical protein WCW34_05990 [Patescibacteria group bacterium]